MNHSDPNSRRNNRVLFAGAVLAGLMMGLSYASVPLYTLFCRVTGLGGTPERVAAAPPSTHQADARIITVSFDANTDPNLPWDFKPLLNRMDVRVGDTMNATYRVHNRSDKTLTGTATYNVQPDKAGVHFDKVQCFCFTQQTLKAGESADLGVQFYVDPAIAKDVNSQDVKNITLSYTFFLAKKQGEEKNTVPVTTPKSSL